MAHCRVQYTAISRKVKNSALRSFCLNGRFYARGRFSCLDALNVWMLRATSINTGRT